MAVGMELMPEDTRGGSVMETTAPAQKSSEYLSSPFLDRVRRSYKLALDASNNHNGRIWGDIDKRRAPVHAALLAETDDDLRNIFADPVSSDLFCGVDYLCRSILGQVQPMAEAGKGAEVHADSSRHTRASLVVIAGVPVRNFDERGIADHFDDLGRSKLFLLAQALGIDNGDLASFDHEKALRHADGRLSQTILFPALFRGELGLRTTRGIAGYRAILALYQTWRTLSLLSDCEEKSVIEIGPGMGRTAYYVYRAGLTDYTTVDLPMGIVAQACFLGAALGPEKLWMLGDDEALAAGRIKLLSAGHRPNRVYGLALNTDSMTEMPLRAALDYMNWIRQHSRLFLSINHDVNLFTVAQISTKWFKRAERRPYPMQEGYMEEVFIPRRFPWLIGWHRIAWHTTKTLVRRAPGSLRRRMQQTVAVLYKPQ
jgi:hypothetical protein